jgi:AcrR family transcriptional regulator
MLAAAWALMAAGGAEALTMDAVAQATGVSRQTVYLHFGTRGGLLLALVEHADERLGLGDLIATIAAAPTSAARVLQCLRVTARYAPRIHELAMALEAARRHDPEVGAAFEDRMARRRAELRGLVQTAAQDDALAAGWSVDEVTDALWTLGTPATWQHLVVERGWSPERYEEFLVQTAQRAFLID